MSVSLIRAFNNLGKARQAFRRCEKAERPENLFPSQTCVKDVTSFTLSSGESFLYGNEIAMQAYLIVLSHYTEKNSEGKARDHERGYLGLHFENGVS